jgi:hypothetical protein
MNPSEVDSGIFSNNPDYVAIRQSLVALEGQLSQAHNDIKQLIELKSSALADPDKFLKLLEDRGECAKRFPHMQHIQKIPLISVSLYQRRYTRRANSKYDQNLDYLVGRIAALQPRHVSTSQLSVDLPICGTPASQIGDDWSMVDSVRQKFKEIVGLPIRAASAPALFLGKWEEHHVSPASTSEAPNRSALFSPQPRKAGSVQFTLPFAPSNDASRTSSPAVVGNSGPPTPGSAGQRKKRKRASEHAHHNLPWTEEERRRLIELLDIYPEEEVQARRFAKIAAAVGTRTAGQVANRVNKMQLKKMRLAMRDEERIDPGGNLDEFLDSRQLQSAEYQEYLMLKRQVETLEANPDTSVHLGFRCDDCGMEPIVGTRWRCTKCHEPNAIDLCQECYECGEFQANTHRPDHRFLRHEH